MSFKLAVKASFSLVLLCLMSNTPSCVIITNRKLHIPNLEDVPKLLTLRPDGPTTESSLYILLLQGMVANLLVRLIQHRWSLPPVQYTLPTCNLAGMLLFCCFYPVESLGMLNLWKASFISCWFHIMDLPALKTNASCNSKTNWLIALTTEAVAEFMFDN